MFPYNYEPINLSSNVEKLIQENHFDFSSSPSVINLIEALEKKTFNNPPVNYPR